jgi:hypothetical protein
VVGVFSDDRAGAAGGAVAMRHASSFASVPEVVNRQVSALIGHRREQSFGDSTTPDVQISRVVFTAAS